MISDTRLMQAHPFYTYIGVAMVLFVAMAVLRHLIAGRSRRLAGLPTAGGLLAVAAVTRLVESAFLGSTSFAVSLSTRHPFRANAIILSGGLRRAHNRPPALLLQRKHLLRY